ncbi:hypothetical protein TNCV_2524481 [Trichonephila clavipes]|nr:hypothetical protein TNCV_2524481 [Trichonephila clavipes]
MHVKLVKVQSPAVGVVRKFREIEGLADVLSSSINRGSKLQSGGGSLVVKWYWARTCDKASNDLIPIPLGYRGQGQGNTRAQRVMSSSLVAVQRERCTLNMSRLKHPPFDVVVKRGGDSSGIFLLT